MEKGRKKKQELRKTRKDEGSSDNPSGFLYYGHLFSMYIEIFDILTHKTVVLNQKIRYFTSENQSLRVLRHSQTYVAIIQ